MERVCSQCNGKGPFSKNQRRRPNPRCESCIGGASKRRERQGQQQARDVEPQPKKRERTCVCEVWFDGSCVPNPGDGKVGVVIKMPGWELRTCEQLGKSTSNVAEYMGLVRCLQKLLSEPLNYFKFTSLIIHGDSQLVLNQVFGSWQVNEPRLKPLHALCKGLSRRVVAANTDTSAISVPREENQAADLWSHSDPVPLVFRKNSAIFYPALTTFLTCEIFGHSVLASHDTLCGVRDGLNKIDAAFLFSLPRGPDIIESLESVPFHVLEGKTRMTVLGITPVPLKYKILQSKNGKTTCSQESSDHFLVIDNLPVPIHACVDFDKMKGSFHFSYEVDQPKFECIHLEEPYRSNPYWTTNVIFMPYFTQ